MSGTQKITKSLKKNKMSPSKYRVGLPSTPDQSQFINYVKKIFKSKVLTNNGPILDKFEKEIKKKLKINNVVLCSNATVALQVALKTLNSRNVLTTPFTYIATINAIRWIGLNIFFSDISKKTLNLDPKKIDLKLLNRIDTILPVNSFGNFSDFNFFEKIRKKRKCKIIYDSSHCFEVKKNKKSILRYGDASIVSFHATKIFNTCEGGMIIFRKKKDYLKAKKMIQNSIYNGNIDKRITGTNAKMSELHAAWGLTLLKKLNRIISKKRRLFKTYKNELMRKVIIPLNNLAENNFSYLPIIFKSERKLKKINNELIKKNIVCRRYFFPSLDKIIKSKNNVKLTVSNNIAKRILCLPINENMKIFEAKKISKIILKSF